MAASHLYPGMEPKGDLTDRTVKTINQRIKDLFTAKLGATIVNSADTIVISAFLGLTILAMYQNYYFIMSSVMKEFVTYFIAACIITFLCCILCRITRELSLLGQVIINLILSVVLSNIAKDYFL